MPVFLCDEFELDKVRPAVLIPTLGNLFG